MMIIRREIWESAEGGEIGRGLPGNRGLGHTYRPSERVPFLSSLLLAAFLVFLLADAAKSLKS